MKNSLFLKIYGTLIIRSFVTSAFKPMRAVKLKEYGPPQNMYVASDVALPELSSPDHILIKVAATALNRADTVQRKGNYPPPKGESDILGLEVSGIVDSIGPNVEKFKVGEKVMALLGGGGYAEYVSVHQHQVMPVPEGVDLITAAGIPEVWLTSYQLLHLVGKVAAGDTVLIHAAGSGVGTAAIQLVKDVPNTTVIATAGSAMKLNKAKQLGADVLINYKEEDFSEKVLSATEGKGANVILDPVGGVNWEKNIKSLSLEGRWVLYGLMGGTKVDGNLLGLMLKKRAQLIGTTLRTRSLEYKKELVEAFQSSSLQKFSSKKYLPIIDSVMTLEDVVDAHAKMESNVNSGKIILKVCEDLSKQEL